MNESINISYGDYIGFWRAQQYSIGEKYMRFGNIQQHQYWFYDFIFMDIQYSREICEVHENGSDPRIMAVHRSEGGKEPTSARIQIQAP